MYNICQKIENDTGNGLTTSPEKIIQESPVKRRSSSIKVRFVNKCCAKAYSLFLHVFRKPMIYPNPSQMMKLRLNEGHQ